MLTESECQLMAEAYLLRQSETGKELWFAARDDLLPECHRMVEDEGYLDRSWHGDDLVYRLSDTAMAASALLSLFAAHAHPN